ncbi:HNH endonuclease [Pseudomonas sp. 21LCFQ010]|uniref:HNH endonuclease n=1 Tax=Pseudomonas sp. 21LCFQ010 TaxID=2957506 RepID=UPI002097D6FD|nr:HNH endonuclease [Pseudomonas sp. 21LCFQ010]
MNGKNLQTNLTAQYASQQLDVGKVYTRADLKDLFDITAASLRNGIFKPTSLNSVWLFVTERKTADRTQYDDLLEGDVLHMDGQSRGLTDKLLVEHVARNLELLVFYRKDRNEYPGSGFIYEGQFKYHSHEGSTPTKFVLHRQDAAEPMITSIEVDLETQGAFDPTDLKDARTRTLANIVRRKGQSAFRKKLLEAYSSQCAVTGCRVEALLEAAHIFPYLGADTNVVSNGLILRADIHTLFDLSLLWIDPATLKVGMTEELKDSEYWSLNNKPALLPEAKKNHPSNKALTAHWTGRRMS